VLKKTQYKSTFHNFIPNLPVSAILVYPVFSRIFQYLQYWYYQYFPESSSICNTGITSIFQNLQVSAILVLPVFPFPESPGIYNTHILAMTSIF
jgi:hypothetical protein